MSERPLLPSAALDLAGLNRQHVFDIADLPGDVTATCGELGGFRQLILLAHGGRLLWQRVQAAGTVGEHPVDTYVADVVRRWCADTLPGRRTRLLYPGEAPVPLQRLGALAGWHHAAPFMIGVDPQWGPWWAYRAVLLADSDFRASRAVDRAPPCAGCADQPCIAACPAGAMDDGRFALATCLAFRRRAASPCAFTCLAREACPAGAEHRYDAGQLRHSYGQSLTLAGTAAPP
jgi:hypothetical protein